MKIFKTENGRSINFVDDNNVFVGFDFSRHCCEDFGWMLSTIPASNIKTDYDDRVSGENGIDPDGLQFDASHCVKFGYDVEFKLSNGNSVVYLILWNFHNGFYHHGFEMANQNGKKLFEGCV